VSTGLTNLLTLARVSNLPTVWSNVLAAWWLGGGGQPWMLLPLLLGASLLYAGGCTLNDAFDARWDAQHRPERLIPSGRMTRTGVALAGSYEMAAGVMLILFTHPQPWWPVVSLAACIVLYDAWHKQSPLSVLSMGGCRWLLYLTAASVAGEVPRAVILSGGVLCLYIIVLSLVARGEARPNPGNSAPGSRWLLLLVPLAIAALNFTPSSESRPLVNATLFHFTAHLPGSGHWVPPLVFAAGLAVLLPWRSRNVGQWVNRLLAAIPLLDLALVLAFFAGGAGVGFAFDDKALALFPLMVLLSLVFQRRFQAT
jgi:hypothetical protein